MSQMFVAKTILLNNDYKLSKLNGVSPENI